jgi:RNA polymerase sigma factor (sigma-70 family)
MTSTVARDFCRTIEKAQLVAVTPFDRFVAENMPLVLYVAKRIRGNNVTDDDLSNGLFALVVAAKRFDPNRGTRFSTFAYYCIRNAIYGERPKFETVSLSSLSEPGVHSDGGIEAVEDADRQATLRVAVGTALSRLPARTRAIVRLRFWDGLTLQQISDQFSLSKERVRQIICGALRAVSGSRKAKAARSSLKLAVATRPLVFKTRHRPKWTTKHRDRRLEKWERKQARLLVRRQKLSA